MQISVENINPNANVSELSNDALREILRLTFPIAGKINHPKENPKFSFAVLLVAFVPGVLLGFPAILKFVIGFSVWPWLAFLSLIFGCLGCAILFGSAVIGQLLEGPRFRRTTQLQNKAIQELQSRGEKLPIYMYATGEIPEEGAWIPGRG